MLARFSGLPHCFDLLEGNVHVMDRSLCHRPNFGLTTKARVYKGVGRKGSPKVTSHAPRNVGECEGMNLHTPK
jgi:hypothetical protein